jgi:thiaminase/transcriptional activator TenA
VDSPFEHSELFEALKAQSGALWLQAQTHPFVAGLGDGSLSRARFEFFLKQDYAYLQAYARAFAVATAKAPELELVEVCAGLVSDTLDLEMQLHRDYCSEFGITPEELEAVEAAPVTQAYGDFGLAVAHQGSLLDLLVALAPCGVGYGEIGLRLRPVAGFSNGMSTHPYKRWIETYSGDEFQRYSTWMSDTISYLGMGLVPAAAAAAAIRAELRARDLAEQLALGSAAMPEGEAGAAEELDTADGPLNSESEGDGELVQSHAERRLAQLSRLLRAGCRYEWLFWEMAWTQQEWPL